MIKSIPYVLTGIGIIVSILYYTNTLRNQTKTREAQLFLALVNSYSSYEGNLAAMKLLNLKWQDARATLDAARQYFLGCNYIPFELGLECVPVLN